MSVDTDMRAVAPQAPPRTPRPGDPAREDLGGAVAQGPGGRIAIGIWQAVVWSGWKPEYLLPPRSWPSRRCGTCSRTAGSGSC